MFKRPMHTLLAILAVMIGVALFAGVYEYIFHYDSMAYQAKQNPGLKADRHSQ